MGCQRQTRRLAMQKPVCNVHRRCCQQLVTACRQHGPMSGRLLAGWRGTVGEFTGERRTGGGNDTRVAGSQRRRLPSAEPIVSGDTCTWQTRARTYTQTPALYRSAVKELTLRILTKHCSGFFLFFVRRNFSNKTKNKK